MMYGKNLAVAIKSGGKVLREQKENVYLPFGAEYSVFIKNLNTVRVKIGITIDGQDVTGGKSLVVAANSEVNLERYLNNNNLSQGNRFKFIERTAGVEQHRGIAVEDGLIRIEYSFEYISPVYYNPSPWIVGDCLYRGNPRSGFWGDGTTTTFTSTNGISGNMGARGVEGLDGNRGCEGWVGATSASCAAAPEAPAPSALLNQTRSIERRLSDYQQSKSAFKNFVAPEVENDVGVTVPGSVSDQKFNTVADFVTDGTNHVLIMKLIGGTESGYVQAPVTVAAKPRCISCGKQNKATSKFCAECGTGLVLV